MYNITQMAADVIMIQAKMQQEYELYQSNIDIAEQEKMRLDKNVAKFKLDSMNISIDTLTKEQKEYLQNWKEGTL